MWLLGTIVLYIVDCVLLSPSCNIKGTDDTEVNTVTTSAMREGMTWHNESISVSTTPLRICSASDFLSASTASMARCSKLEVCRGSSPGSTPLSVRTYRCQTMSYCLLKAKGTCTNVSTQGKLSPPLQSLWPDQTTFCLGCQSCSAQHHWSLKINLMMISSSFLCNACGIYQAYFEDDRQNARIYMAICWVPFLPSWFLRLSGNISHEQMRQRKSEAARCSIS